MFGTNQMGFKHSTPVQIIVNTSRKHVPQIWSQYCPVYVRRGPPKSALKAVQVHQVFGTYQMGFKLSTPGQIIVNTSRKHVPKIWSQYCPVYSRRGPLKSAI